jgi:hypothetical protein
MQVVPMNLEGLYEWTRYGDNAAGELTYGRPVTTEGIMDPARKPLFIGQTTLNIGGNQIPIFFGLAAETLKEAFEKWSAGCEAACETWLSEQRRRAIEMAAQQPIPHKRIIS